LRQSPPTAVSRVNMSVSGVVRPFCFWRD